MPWGGVEYSFKKKDTSADAFTAGAPHNGPLVTTRVVLEVQLVQVSLGAVDLVGPNRRQASGD